MEIDDSVFKKYFTLNNIEIESDFNIPDLINPIIDKHIETKDNACFEFLIKNGYQIDKPYKIEQLEQIKYELAKKDRFLDCIEYHEIIPVEDGYKSIYHVFPFFNSISCPISKEFREELTLHFKELTRKERANGKDL